MVGHTGDYDAIIKAVETVDQCTKEVVEAGLKSDYAFIIIADHGNADFTINADGSPNTAHTTNLVPSFIEQRLHAFKQRKTGRHCPNYTNHYGNRHPPRNDRK